MAGLKKPDGPAQGRLFEAAETSPAYAEYLATKERLGIGKNLQPKQFITVPAKGRRTT